jgi:mannitol-1-phosphate/altronate dehydrogenase
MSSIQSINDSQISHIHIGAGSFGLGMVVDICHREASFRTAVITKSSDKQHQRVLRENGGYSIIYDDDRNSATMLAPLIRVYDDEHDSHILDLLVKPSVVLITTSVRKENLDAVARLLAQAFERRSTAKAGEHVCVIACENLPQNSAELEKLVNKLLSPAARSYTRTRIFFCNTLVDRVCAKLCCRSGLVEVPVERFYQWVIQKPKSELSAIRRLEERKLIMIAETEIEFSAYEVQKYWCMNGLHLAAAAYLYNYRPEMEILADTFEISVLSKKLRALERELGAAFAQYTTRFGLQRRFSGELIRRYGDSVVERLRRNRTDKVGRILKQEKTPEESAKQVLDRIERLIAPHCEIMARHKGLIEPRADLIAAHEESKPIPRLQLDDAILQVVLAMRRYHREYAGLPQD